MVNKNNFAKIYVDMDGVLAKWNPYASIEDTFTKGYFLNCRADDLMITVVRELAKKYEVAVISHAYQNGLAESEKLQWLQNNRLGDLEHIFIPYGEIKQNYAVCDQEIAVLIDDFSKNLMQWEDGWYGYLGIKYYNGINGNKGSWKLRNGAYISNKMSINDILNRIDMYINKEKERLYINKEAELAIDEHERIYGADGEKWQSSQTIVTFGNDKPESERHSMAELKAMAKKHVKEHNNSDISKNISVPDLSK